MHSMLQLPDLLAQLFVLALQLLVLLFEKKLARVRLTDAARTGCDAVQAGLDAVHWSFITY